MPAEDPNQQSPSVARREKIGLMARPRPPPWRRRAWSKSCSGSSAGSTTCRARIDLLSAPMRRRTNSRAATAGSTRASTCRLTSSKLATCVPRTPVPTRFGSPPLRGGLPLGAGRGGRSCAEGTARPDPDGRPSREDTPRTGRVTVRHRVVLPSPACVNGCSG